jgi:hypothetical protein
VSLKAEPTMLQSEDPLTLRLLIRADGPVQKAPARPRLGALSAFTSRFFVEDVSAGHPDEHNWEFVYRLRPRSPAVKSVPAFHFAYYRPGFGYQDRYTETIELHVRPRTEVSIAEVEHSSVLLPPLDITASWVEGPVVLQHEDAWSLPSLPLLGLLLAAAPLACTCWHLLWRQLYPDAARQMRRRRSRAGRLALQELRKAEFRAPAEEADYVVRIVTRYLHDRFNLPAAEPTPVETAAHLKEAGCPAALVDRAASFYRLCDTARFAPDVEAEQMRVTDAAIQLVLAVEGES